MTTYRPLLISLLLLSAPAFATNPELVKEDVEKAKKLTRESVEKDAKVKPGEKALGCADLREQGRALCRDGILRGHKGNCAQIVTALNMSVQQAKGELFDVEKKHGAAAGSNARAADAACRVHLRSIERDRTKHDAAMRPDGSAGAQCQALAEKVDAVCWTALDSGEMPPQCARSLQLVRGGSQDPEALCKIALATLGQ